MGPICRVLVLYFQDEVQYIIKERVVSGVGMAMRSEMIQRFASSAVHLLSIYMLKKQGKHNGIGCFWLAMADRMSI